MTTDTSPGTAGTSRRRFLAGSALGAAMLPTFLWSSTAAARSGGGSNVLVVVFLRGGCDGLTLVPPVAEGAYHDARPVTAVPESAALALGGPAPHAGLALHPAATRLAQLHGAGRVAIVPAAGSPDRSRSHFDSQAGIESGRPEHRASVVGGWIGRHLSASAGTDHPLRGFSAGTGLPASMGGYEATAANTIADLGLLPWGPDRALVTQLLSLGYTPQVAGEELSTWSRLALDAMDELDTLLGTDTSPPSGWPSGQFATRLFTIARLLEAGLPVQIATADVGGWDLHNGMGAATNANALGHRSVSALDAALGAFVDRLDDYGLGERVTVVALTEFGRRVRENSSAGTDHGLAGPMLVLGGGVAPGVHGEWPGVAPQQLDDGDVRVTVDQRRVLAELLVRRQGATDLSAVFPGFDVSPGTWLGVCQP